MAEQDDVQMVALAREAATPDARSIAWFTELVDGRGVASGVGAALRDVLVIASADAASEQAAATRMQEQRQQDLERERDRAEEQERGQRQKALNKAITAGAFVTLWHRFWIALVIVGLTPVAASFATIIPVLGERITPIVFFLGEAGNTAGSGPAKLYLLLASTVGVVLGIAFASDIALGMPRDDLADNLPYVGGLIGLAIFGAQWWFGTLVAASWVITPLLIAAGYLIAAARTGVRLRLARGEAVSIGQARGLRW